MTLSIKSIGGIINEVPKVSNLKVTDFNNDSIDIEYKVEDVELTICRHYLLLNGERKEITKQVGYESDTNIFRYKIIGLKMNTPYTIQIVASDGHDEGLSQAIQQATKNLVTYGIRIMENNSNPSTSITYTDDAIGVQVANKLSLGGWEDKFPFNSIKTVGFKNGQITKEINPNNKIKYVDGGEVPSDVDVMIEIPKVYWKINRIQNGYEIKISNLKSEGYECYAHKVNGEEKEKLYIGAYLGYVENGKLRSKSGVMPTCNKTLNEFRRSAKLNGNRYRIDSWYQIILEKILFMIAYKNKNSQTSLGYGNVASDANIKNTGGTNSKGMIYGGNKYEQMCFLGIEDLWGNTSCIVDGIVKNGKGEMMICQDNTSFNDNGVEYKNFGNFQGSNIVQGFISKVRNGNETFGITTEFSGSISTHYCDYSSNLTSGIGTVGGGKQGENNGIFSLGFGLDVLETGKDIGARLCYL